jgi:predicted dithiol-disulfide oxidoreductase (DUF899 family)
MTGRTETKGKTIDGNYRQTNLENESQEYLSKREELRLAELELMKNGERVAALRRALPKGPAVQDYVFEEGPASLDDGDTPIKKIRLSELITAPNRALVVYQFMFGKKNTEPCPMCTLIIDGWNGVAHHLAQTADIVIVAAAEPAALRAHARARRWDRLRLLSAGSSTFKYDLGSEDQDGNQDATVSVFTRDNDGAIRHFYSTHPGVSMDQKERGLDLLCPVYNILDLTPQGRGDWYADLSYGIRVHAAHR